MKPRRTRPTQVVLAGTLAAVSAALAAVTPAKSAETLSEDGLGGLPPLTVRPSGFEDPEAEARARQERLLARMRQNEFRFRSICTLCGSGGAAPSTPFRPIETLGMQTAPASE